MYFPKYSKYKPSNTSICENYIKPVGIFGNHLSKCPDVKRKRRHISLLRVPPGRTNKVKTYFSSVGSSCRDHFSFFSFSTGGGGRRIVENSTKECFIEVSRMFHASFMKRKFHRCFKKFSQSFKGVLREFEGVSRLFKRSSKDDSRKF